MKILTVIIILTIVNLIVSKPLDKTDLEVQKFAKTLHKLAAKNQGSFAWKCGKDCKNQRKMLNILAEQKHMSLEDLLKSLKDGKIKRRFISKL